jgi:hypothetical protein
VTGPEHYRKAEECAAQADRHLTEDLRDMEIAKVAMGIGQVHATLALAAATREIGDQLDTLPRPLVQS